MKALRRGDQQGKKKKYLVLALGSDREVPFVTALRIGQPLEQHTGLFRRFADLHPGTENKILDFSAEFGWLLAGSQKEPISRADFSEAECQSLGSYLYVQAEPIRRWNAEIRPMRRLVDVWDSIQKREKGVSTCLDQPQDVVFGDG